MPRIDPYRISAGFLFFFLKSEKYRKTFSLLGRKQRNLLAHPSLRVGVPRIELGSHAPKAYILPLYYTPLTNKDYYISTVFANNLQITWYNICMIHTIDSFIIGTARKLSIPFARFAIFVVFFWFGLLKVIGESPANPLVSSLLEKTLPFITFDQFILLFGLFEMLIGVVFLIPRLERLAIFLLMAHMVTTVMPLFLLPTVAWQKAWVPTLEGQYIIKNLAIIGLAISIAAHLHRPHP